MSSTPAGADRPGAGKTAVTNVRVFDGQGLRPPGTVVIDGDRIGTGPPGAHIIDGDGGVLLPGLIDAHVHVRDRTRLIGSAASGLPRSSTWPAARPPWWTPCARSPG